MSAEPMKSIKITRGIFDAAKLLIENGATNGEIQKYLKVSRDVVTMFRQAESYEEYQALMFERNNRNKQLAAIKKKEQEKKEEPKEPVTQIVEHRQTVTVQATWQMTQEMQKTNRLLEQISNKLAFIVDELCGVKAGNGNAESDH